jgi:malate permease and related proteins
MNDLPRILSAMLPVVVCIAAGVLARRLKWLTEEADRSLITLTIRLLMPCYIVHRLNTLTWNSTANELIYAPFSGVALTTLGFGLCGLAVRFFGRAMGLTTPAQVRTFVLCCGMYNYGYIPYPLAERLYPGDGITFASLVLHNVGVEIAMWTVGLLILSGRLGPRWYVGVFNPVTIAILVALLLKFTGGWNILPGGVHQSVGWLAGCAIPVGLLLTGATIADVYRQSNLRAGVGTLVGASALRLAALPAVFLLLLTIFPTTLPLHRVIAIQAAMPAAIFPIVLARHYGGDPATAVRVVLGTQILSVVTIPIWLTTGLP